MFAVVRNMAALDPAYRPTDLHQLKNMCLLLLTVIASYLAFGVPEPPADCPSNTQLPPLRA